MKNQLGISYNWAVKPHGLVSRGHVVEIHAAVEIFSDGLLLQTNFEIKLNRHHVQI